MLHDIFTLNLASGIEPDIAFMGQLENCLSTMNFPTLNFGQLIRIFWHLNFFNFPSIKVKLETSLYIKGAKYVFSNHSIKRMQQRGFSFDTVKPFYSKATWSDT